MGGFGQSAPPRHGGSAGDGGNVHLTFDSDTRVTLRDFDIATGSEIETLRHQFFVSGGTGPQVVCTASGAHGGAGLSNGDGGNGGNAGDFTLNGGDLHSVPAQFVNLYDIRGFPPGDPLEQGDDFCSNGRIIVGHVIEALDASGAPLYRARVSSSGVSLLGGVGWNSKSSRCCW